MISPDELLLEARGSDAVLRLELCSAQPPGAVGAQQGAGVIRVQSLGPADADSDGQQTEQDLHCYEVRMIMMLATRNMKYAIQADGRRNNDKHK